MPRLYKTVQALSAAAMLLAGPASAFELQSPQIREGMPLAEAQAFTTCKGGNISPALAWRDPPAGTKSYAVTMFDPAANGGSGFWHWLVFNIRANTAALSENAGAADGSHLPAGAAQGVNDWGTHGYGGPCPPNGQTHRYIVTLWALDTARLSLAGDVTGKKARAQLQLHMLKKASLTARYSH